LIVGRKPLDDTESSRKDNQYVDLFGAGGKSLIKTANEISKKANETVTSKTLLELQAELLRLEAEKEQLQITQIRLNDEKVIFYKLNIFDRFIISFVVASTGSN